MWHRFISADGVTLMTATPLPTDQIRLDVDDPRTVEPRPAYVLTDAPWGNTIPHTQWIGSQASAAHAKPILRSTPGAGIGVASVASIESFLLRLRWLHPGREPLRREHLVDRGPRTDDRKSRAIDHHLGHERAAVVARSHDRTVRASRAYHDEVSGRKRRQITV